MPRPTMRLSSTTRNSYTIPDFIGPLHRVPVVTDQIVRQSLIQSDRGFKVRCTHVPHATRQKAKPQDFFLNCFVCVVVLSLVGRITGRWTNVCFRL